MRANAPIFRSSSFCEAELLWLAVSSWIEAAVMSTSLAATTLLADCVYVPPAVRLTLPPRLPTVLATWETWALSSKWFFLL